MRKFNIRQATAKDLSRIAEIYIFIIELIKKVIYFVAEYDNQQICCQEDELEGAYLMKYGEAMENFYFDSSKRILREAKNFIK